jgi:hypothetical protein
MIKIFMISILPIGTCDAKAGEIRFPTLVMDLGALGQRPFQPDYSNDDTAPGWRFRDSE